MKRIILHIVSVLCISVVNTHAQKLSDEQLNASGAVKIYYVENIENAELLAKTDIENKVPFIFIHGGIAPVHYTTDKSFMEKYSVYYEDFGCVAPEYKFVNAYNRVVFKLLDEKFGKKWRSEIRKDVIGFKEYRKNSR